MVGRYTDNDTKTTLCSKPPFKEFREPQTFSDGVVNEKGRDRFTFYKAASNGSQTVTLSIKLSLFRPPAATKLLEDRHVILKTLREK